MFEFARNVENESSQEIETMEEKDSACLGRRRPSRSPFLKVLKKLTKKNEAVTIIIRAGGNCCDLEGCVLAVSDEIVTLLLNECGRIYIRVDCICAVIDPAD
ncbi:hypothetical protein [Natronospora cellulosivora (SeqCode)]